MLVMVAMAMSSRSTTVSMAEEYRYRLDVDIHGEPFTGSFWWDDGEVEAAVPAAEGCDFERGYTGTASMLSTDASSVQVSYRVPLFVFHRPTAVAVCIPYTRENLLFTMAADGALTYAGGGNHTRDARELQRYP